MIKILIQKQFMVTEKQPRLRGIQNVYRVPILPTSNTKLQMQAQ